MITTGRITTISISEKTCSYCKEHRARERRSRIIIHDGWQWHIGTIHNESQLEEFLNFFEIELTTIEHEAEYPETGKIISYYLSKNINNPSDGGFWNLEQLQEMSQGKKLKKIKGYSNGSLVDCYIGIGENVVDIYRPNPNAKEVYNAMEIEEHLAYIRNIDNWYI